MLRCAYWKCSGDVSYMGRKDEGGGEYNQKLSCGPHKHELLIKQGYKTYRLEWVKEIANA